MTTIETVRPLRDADPSALPGDPRMATIVLATDGSADAFAARLATAALARASGACVHVIQTWHESVSAYAGFVPVAPMTEQLEREAMQSVADETQALRDAGVVDATWHVESGRPATMVLDLADKVDADLIVVGSRGNGAFHRLLLGSVSEAIVHGARRPVLVMRGGRTTWPPSHVVAAFDGSPEACHAAHIGALLARAAGCAMSMLRVVPHDAEARMTALDVTFGDALEGVTGQLERHTSRFSKTSNSAVAGSVSVGDPAAAIVEAVEGPGKGGLAALGSHGSGLGHRLVLGSVSTKVLHALHGSVLIVPPPRTAG